jgi:hypothetical protein
MRNSYKWIRILISHINLTAPLHKNTVQVRVLSAKTQALVDTGAGVSIVSKSFLHKANFN